MAPRLRVTELLVHLEEDTFDEPTLEMQTADEAGRLAARMAFEAATRAGSLVTRNAFELEAYDQAR